MLYGEKRNVSLMSDVEAGQTHHNDCQLQDSGTGGSITNNLRY